MRTIVTSTVTAGLLAALATAQPAKPGYNDNRPWTGRQHARPAVFHHGPRSARGTGGWNDRCPEWRQSMRRIATMIATVALMLNSTVFC
jgi:hypothetical protein